MVGVVGERAGIMERVVREIGETVRRGGIGMVGIVVVNVNVMGVVEGRAPFDAIDAHLMKGCHILQWHHILRDGCVLVI